MTTAPQRSQSGRSTLRDVAKEAGVSIKTASRVVNREQVVSPETAERVMRAISKLDYQPDEVARSLRRRSSRTIGLMIADISNPFYARCAKAVEEVSREHGYAVLLCASDEDELIEESYLDLLSRRRVDGLLLIPATRYSDAGVEQSAFGFPVVAFDRPLEGRDTVLVKNRRGTREAVGHLFWHGHRRVAFIGGQKDTYTVQKRLEGYREGVQEAGAEEISRFGAVDVESATRITSDLLDSAVPPTAFFAWNNLAIVGVLAALSRRDLAVPDDIAVVGFDDFELGALLHPRLTLVHQPAAELGHQAARLLFERLKDPPSEPRRIVLDTGLVVRNSCGCKQPGS